ncbi:Relaxase [Pseudomonas sp. IT-P74]
MTMADPLDKATSKAPATLGEGCLSRYDPDDMGPETGTEFPDAARLWEQLQQESEDKPKPA